MKNLFKITAMSLLLAFVACGEDSTEGVDPDSGSTENDNTTTTTPEDEVCSLSVSLTSMTRASFTESNDDIAITWASGDGVALYDASGDYVEAFSLSSGSGTTTGTFECSKDVSDGTYTVVFPSLGSSYTTLTAYEAGIKEKLASQTQVGSILSHLNTACYMDGSVTISDNEGTATLAHNTALLSIAMEISGEPTKIVVDDTYTLSMSLLSATGGIYTANILVDTSTIAIGDFDIDITYGTENTEVSETETIDAQYVAGKCYDLSLEVINYSISNEDELFAFATAVANADDTSDMEYTITKDITLTKECTPIASYKGVLDGGGNKIIDLVIDQSSTAKVSFILALGGTIKDLTFENPTVTGQQYTAVFSSLSVAGSSIENCHIVGGSVTSAGDGTVSNGDYTGGFVADCWTNITGCSNSATISGARSYVGGIAGIVRTSITISECSNSGTINGATTAFYTEGGAITNNANSAGGLVGMIYNTSGVLTKSYNTGDVSGQQCVGGVIGKTNNTGDYVR